MGNNNEIAAAALTLKVALPPTLLARCWTQAIETKNWTAAALVAGNASLDGQLRRQVKTCMNAAVRTAYLDRDDVDADEAFGLCIDERRPGVLNSLSRHRSDEYRERYLSLLVAAYAAKPNIGLAKAILDIGDTARVENMPEATAVDILLLMAGKHSRLTSNQMFTTSKWMGALTGPSASAVIRSALAANIWHYAGHRMLLTAPGRTRDQVHADTSEWLARCWSEFGGDQRQRLGIRILREICNTCGSSGEAATVGDAIADWVKAGGGDEQAILAQLVGMSHLSAVTRPEQFPTTGEPDTLGEMQPTQVDDDRYDDIARKLHLMTLSSREKLHVDADTFTVYLTGPGQYTRAGRRVQFGSADAIGRAVYSTDARLVELGWTTAAQHAMAVDANTYRHGWDSAAANPAVRSALLAMWRADMSLEAFDDISLASLAWALDEARRTQPNDYTLNQACLKSIDELVRRELYADVPWAAISVAAQAGVSWWQTSMRMTHSTLAPVLAWLANQVETCEDPDRIWVVVNSCSPTFTGTAAELLAAASDACGISFDCGSERLRLPISIRLEAA